MQNIVLITNPISGNGASAKAAHVAKQTLSALECNVHIACTDYAGHAIVGCGSVIIPKNLVEELGFVENEKFLVRKTKSGISLRKL